MVDYADVWMFPQPPSWISQRAIVWKLRRAEHRAFWQPASSLRDLIVVLACQDQDICSFQLRPDPAFPQPVSGVRCICDVRSSAARRD